MTQTASTIDPRPADKLCGVCVGLREDLEVSRHVFRGSPAYVVRDPITFQSQRLDPDDYAVLSRIRAERSLGATFESLVSEGRLESGDEDRFYEFVMSLHALGFLRLPLSDDRMLYKRFLLREQIRRREKFTNFLFLRIPLWNPNAFLDRTIDRVRPLFSTAAHATWVILVTCAAFVAVRNWHEIVNPLHNVLVVENLFLMWLTLVVLKVFHEFGHAYACKHYGGHVPEMGLYLMLLTPCAYVDATSAWGFSKKRHRLFVSLAGMYVEIALASLAVIVWAATGPSLINSIAHNTIFLASAVTLLFNVNPLMRYDGYYILCDLVEVPNLRARSARCLLAQLKRLLFGIAPEDERGGRRLTAILCTFGIASALYRTSLMIVITAVLASKMFVVGVMVGVIMVGRMLSSLVLRLTRFLWYAEETVNKRIRAVAISVVLLLVVPTGVMWIPIQNNVYAAGVAHRTEEVVVRAATPGFVEAVFATPGERVARDAPLARLANDGAVEQLAEAEAQLRSSDMRRDAFRERDPDRLAEEDAAAAAVHAQIANARGSLQRLEIAAPINGDIVQAITDDDRGRYLREGEPIVTIVAGSWEVRTVLTAEQFAAGHPRTGTGIQFRPVSNPAIIIQGRVARIVPAGSHTIAIEALTQLGGRDIAVDPVSHRATEPYFELAAELDDVPPDLMRIGLTGEIRIDGQREPVGIALVRRAVRFWHKLRRD